VREAALKEYAADKVQAVFRGRNTRARLKADRATKVVLKRSDSGKHFSMGDDADGDGEGVEHMPLYKVKRGSVAPASAPAQRVTTDAQKAKIMRAMGEDASALRAAGLSATDGKLAGYSEKELQLAGYTARDLAKANLAKRVQARK